MGTCFLITQSMLLPTILEGLEIIYELICLLYIYININIDHINIDINIYIYTCIYIFMYMFYVHWSDLS